MELALSGVLQSGPVTPGHLASWTTDGVIQDSGVTFNNSMALFRSTILHVNFNTTNFDNEILINLPAGYTRWRCNRVMVTNPSGSMAAGTCGLFTGAGGTGVQIVTSGTALTITTAALDTNNNAQSLTVNNANTLMLSDTAVFFRLQNGVPNTADVTVEYEVYP